MSKKKGDGDILKDLMKTTGTAKVREALGEYLKALKTGKGGIPCEPQGPLLFTQVMFCMRAGFPRQAPETSLDCRISCSLGVESSLWVRL